MILKLIMARDSNNKDCNCGKVLRILMIVSIVLGNDGNCCDYKIAVNNIRVMMIKVSSFGNKF